VALLKNFIIFTAAKVWFSSGTVTLAWILGYRLATEVGIRLIGRGRGSVRRGGGLPGWGCIGICTL
jgi:hypothetical protein